MADAYDHEADWQEAIDSNQPGGGVALSNETQEATLVGYIDWNKQRSAARFFLGFSWADDAAPWYLHREPPHAHPVCPWLYADSVSFSGVGPESADDNDTGAPYETSPFDETSRNALYQKALCTVRYRAVKGVRFLEDDDIPDVQSEWYRYTVITSQGSVDVLSADGVSQLAFAETAAGGPSLGPPPQKFPAPIGVQLHKTVYRVSWLWVPLEYVSEDTDFFKGTKLDNCVGKVNSNAAFGGRFPIGTLLMRPYTVEHLTAPVAPADLSTPLRYCNIHMEFEFFDPPTGVASPTYRGHNLMPFRADGKFYLATRDGTTSLTKALYPSADFDQIFEHVLS